MSISPEEAFPSVTLYFEGSASMALKPQDYLIQEGQIVSYSNCFVALMLNIIVGHRIFLAIALAIWLCIIKHIASGISTVESKVFFL